MPRASKHDMKPKPKQPKALWYRMRHGNKPKQKARKKIRPVSKAMAKRRAAYRKAAVDFLNGCLCACSTPGICGTGSPHPATEVHHARGRNWTLLMDERFWLPVCAKAHRWIHDHPADARRLGLLCDVGDWNKPVKEWES